jgi:hypothetical protein
MPGGNVAGTLGLAGKAVAWPLKALTLIAPVGCIAGA